MELPYISASAQSAIFWPHTSLLHPTMLLLPPDFSASAHSVLFWPHSSLLQPTVRFFGPIHLCFKPQCVFYAPFISTSAHSALFLPRDLFFEKKGRKLRPKGAAYIYNVKSRVTARRRRKERYQSRFDAIHWRRKFNGTNPLQE